MNKPIILRQLQIKDFDQVAKWSEDEAFCLANDWETKRSKEELYSWWERSVQNQSTTFFRYGIEYNTRLIGYCDLANINGDSAELGIAIGERELWGSGVGTEALKKFMVYAGEERGIQIFEAETHETNARSRRMLEKIGFTEVSRIGTEEYMGKETQLIQYSYNRGVYNDSK